MDWKTLFLSASGRSGQKDFWIGFAILFVGGIVLSIIPLIGLLGIVLIYPWVCLYSKRLHDFGKSGWLAAVPFAIGVVGGIILAGSMGAAIFAGANAGANAGAAAGAGVMAALAGSGLIMLLIALVGLGFLLWVGLSKSDPGVNRYGPPPISAIGGAATTI